MAKKGMKRPDRTHTQPKNDAPPVPEIQGKKTGRKATEDDVIDSDLGKDNFLNDLPEADKQQL